MLFNSESKIVRILQYIASRHPSISFICEKESSVFRKNTFAGLGPKFDSFVSNRYLSRNNFLLTFIECCFRIKLDPSFYLAPTVLTVRKRPIYVEIPFVSYDHCERRWAKRSVACSQKPPSAITYGNTQEGISRLVLILGTQSIEPKKSWSGSARTNPTMPLFDGLFLKSIKRCELETST